MAWLFIDTHENGRVRHAWLGDGRVLKYVEKYGRASMLLPDIAKERASMKKEGDIEGVCVVEGPGSFSAIRGGVLVANVMARFLSVPLVAVSVERVGNLEALASSLCLGKEMKTSYVAPVYDREPNITAPKAQLAIQ